MCEPKFKIGDRVRWSSHSRHQSEVREGLIVHVVQPGESPQEALKKLLKENPRLTSNIKCKPAGAKRRRYFVLVPGFAGVDGRIYFPHTSKLQRLDVLEDNFPGYTLGDPTPGKSLDPLKMIPCAYVVDQNAWVEYSDSPGLFFGRGDGHWRIRCELQVKVSRRVKGPPNRLSLQSFYWSGQTWSRDASAAKAFETADAAVRVYVTQAKINFPNNKFSNPLDILEAG